jgi:mannose-6-phosphate isomerase-like protein (cupin superfamily)
MHPDELTVGSDRISFKLTSEQSGGDVAIFEVTIPPGGGPPMLHRHDPFELYRVRSGELSIYLEGKDGRVSRTVAGPGSVVPINGGLEHTIRNESDRDAEAMVVFSPGEPMERFARAAGEHGRDPHEVLALAWAHRIEITRSIEDALTGSGDQPHRQGYLTIARFSGDPAGLLGDYHKYAGVMSEVGRDHRLTLHAGAKTDNGFLVVNLWPSKEGSEAAARDPRRRAILERSGIDRAHIRREHYELEDLIVFD